MTHLTRLFADRSGVAAAEMALVMPIFVVLIFGCFELGNFFLSEHVLQKSVRDAARYAARLPVDTSYPACAASAGAEASIRRLARSGDPDGDSDDDGQADQRLHGWTADTMTTVSVTCDTSGTYRGIYDEFTIGVPIVTVSASVPYPTLFNLLGLGTANAAKCAGGQTSDRTCLTLNAQSQSAVYGA